LWIGGGSGLLNSATYISFYTTGSGVNTLVGKERMMITSGGNIGIGTSIPSASLHVAVNGQGGLLTQDILTVQGGGSPSGNYGFMCKAFNGDKLFYTDHLTYNVIMGTTGGKVGIGTTAPAYKLDVVGDINSSTNIACATGLFSGNKTVTISALNTAYQFAPVTSGIVTARDNTNGGSGIWLMDPNGNSGNGQLIQSSWVNGTYIIYYSPGGTYVQKTSGNVPVLLQFAILQQ
jgi:hypothetical protein